MCDLDDESSYRDFYKTVSRRARREHTCCACKSKIRIRDVYMHTSGVFDSSPFRMKHCLRCWAMLDEIVGRASGSVAWELNCGELWEDNFGPLPDNVARLAFMTPDEAQRELVHAP